MEESELLYRRRIAVERLKERWDSLNKRIVFKFYENCLRKGLSVARACRLIQILTSADRYFQRPFSQLMRKDFDSYYEWLGNNMTPQSRYTYMVGLKQFYKWFDRGKHFKKINIKMSKPKCPYSSNDMFTEEEQDQIIESADNPFWKAFLDGFRYSRCRPGEFILLKRKDVEINGMGIILRIPKRKNCYSERFIIIKEDCQHFKRWIESISNLDKYLFLKDGWYYARFSSKFRQIVRNAGINKMARLYLFRHTRYTRDWEMGISGETRDALYGHSPESRMRSYYLHLDQTRINNELEKVFHRSIEKRIQDKIMIQPMAVFGINN